MSIINYDHTEEKKFAMTERASDTEVTTRSVFTHQTGQTLITLGTLFKHVPPFNDTIDKSTSETLISLGKKLKATK
jgi:hypothetical protein